MDPIRLLHTADLHLDHVLTDYGRSARAVRRADLIATFNFLVDEAIRSDVKVLLVAGDLICAASAAESTVRTVREGFARLGRALVQVAVAPGESEEHGDLALLREACRPDNVHLFMGEEWSRFSPIQGVTIWGLRTANRNSDIPVLRSLIVEESGRHIGLMHATYADTPGEPISSITRDDLAAAGLDYLALGHHHNRLNCSVGRAQCWYPGSPAHIGYETRGERHCLIVTMRDDGVRVSPLKVPSRAQRVVHMDVTGKTPDQMRKRLEELADPDLCLNLELQGRLEFEQTACLACLEAEFAPRFLDLNVNDDTVPSRSARPSDSVQGDDLEQALIRRAAGVLRRASVAGHDRAGGESAPIGGRVLSRGLKLCLRALREAPASENRET
ncbi:MAG: metallophosphoesterase [Clostridia bacterium]|nr:metallophosphoesterase [Clostridia bacterium]